MFITQALTAKNPRCLRSQTNEMPTVRRTNYRHKNRSCRLAVGRNLRELFAGHRRIRNKPNFNRRTKLDRNALGRRSVSRYLMRSDTERVKMLKRTEEISGVWLQGYTSPTTRAELTAVLGEPIQFEAGDKVTIEWGVRLGGTIATVYDWKRYELGTPSDDELMVYNIGGTDPKAVSLIQGLLELGRKVAV